MSNRIIVAVEIGSSKIKGAVGSVAPDGTLTVSHIEEERLSPNFVRYGAVQNVKEVANVLKSILMKLNNRVSPAKISAVYAAIGGRSLMAIDKRIDTTLHDETEITSDIVEEILGRAESIIDPDREVVDVVPGEFMVDNMTVASPIGTIGSCISAKASVISCRQQILRNISLAISEKLGLKINGFVVRQTAIADMVLTNEERQLGVMLADCGAETTTVSIYKEGFLRSLVTIPLGSRHITRDIMSRNYSEERAEEIKKGVGNAMPESHDSSRLRHEGIDDSEINNYVAARAGEIVINILERISEAGMTAQDLPAGIVVTGNGALLAGFNSLLAEQASLPVRTATVPATVRRANPRMQLGNEIDVVAILYHLASIPTVACVVMPQPVAAPATEPSAATSNPQEEEYVEEVVKTRKSIFSMFKHTIAEIINPSDDTEEESFDGN